MFSTRADAKSVRPFSLVDSRYELERTAIFSAVRRAQSELNANDRRPYMHAVTSSEEHMFILIGAGTGVLLVVIAKIREIAANAPPDPWSSEVAPESLEACDPLCPDCLTPHGLAHRFCPRCAYPVGDFTPLDPYFQNLVVGDLFRRGIAGPPEPGLGRQAFLVILSLNSYMIFAPLYWFWMVRKARGKPICQRVRPAPLE
ncbi:MAG TPA: hypothetical protein VGM73_04560 [Candidatus Didemnitutus sp.]|jgi:hypothetical protein